MQDEEYVALIRPAAELFASGASTKDILKQLGDVKRKLTDQVYALNRANNLVDAMAASVDPNISWDFNTQGWLRTTIKTGQPVAPISSSSERRRKIMEIVASYLSSGTTVIKTKTVADALRAAGDTKSGSALATAVGNVLNRLDGWERTSRGVYEFTEELHQE